ncbi:tetrahydrofolate dehydrogenase/cyclohydrolase catalytic domain-containing protein [[Clostridium] symbiosum]|uniref:bifunctional 5,10-methylenetetrahydrofolate dehydrogenase/5,10-methenyltetrahydrofolate cyclohydrolase n=1 Tax=Clostridium symbiosum TaxID=1512 RepID=UPI001D06D9CF|nr:tetrahydrofolate dehydrogenase/cyclohydrolase catalytic domain-containing protein [[Clostridium] symbiosum]MCB6607223.1 bifunctional 5,10-methylene-tetrahydrofolate dehydrogenase/5,10-methylene-tetrahydrofolate cyclohydrolase [[Clostridium] symbiosum]MCB6929783.1 bifunctional 5,10-methylene-tetrahydrofolate dehydrogenase/5,10-methylene-tetrahydrofolate cyclohydrolase [[Clostridium] symbiosum]
MAKLLTGAPVVAALSGELSKRVERLKAAGITPTLAIVRIGERPADLSYERGASKRCAAIGIEVKHIFLKPDYRPEELMAVVQEINGDPGIHGCLMFRPLARREDELAVCAALKPEKDMDGITAWSQGNVLSGEEGGFAPCTAQACLEILDYYGYPLKSSRVTVIGASMVIGKPVGIMLLNRCATLTMCHIDTVDTASHCRGAEILISAAGCAGLVSKDYVSPGQVVLDVGINTSPEGKLCGDVRFDEVEPIVEAITPVPGGVGTVTSTVLAKHVVEAAERMYRK